MKSDLNGWLGGEDVDCVDQVDFISFRSTGRGTLELSGFDDPAMGSVVLNGKSLTPDEDGIITAALSTEVNYLLELRWDGENSMGYSMHLA